MVEVRTYHINSINNIFVSPLLLNGCFVSLFLVQKEHISLTFAGHKSSLSFVATFLILVIPLTGLSHTQAFISQYDFPCCSIDPSRSHFLVELTSLTSTQLSRSSLSNPFLNSFFFLQKTPWWLSVYKQNARALERKLTHVYPVPA